MHVVSGAQGDGDATSPWAAEREVGAETAARLVAAQFPALAGQRVRPFAAGWDNTVHRVGETWLFRFPRRQVALPGSARELAVLPEIARRLPLPVPEPVWRGRPSGEFPWPFTGSCLLRGRELAESGLHDDERVQAGRALGEFLRVLHDPGLLAELGPVLGTALPVDPLARADPGVRGPMARAALSRLGDAGVLPAPRVVGAVRELLAAAEGLGPPDGGAVLVHGDLHVRHLLVDDAGLATGVIDWGDVCLGDPAMDLALAYAGFAGPARAALLHEYAAGAPGVAVPRDRELRARVLAVFLCATLAEYAAGEGRADLLRESLAGLARAVT